VLLKTGIYVNQMLQYLFYLPKIRRVAFYDFLLHEPAKIMDYGSLVMYKVMRA
jgi:hypothetical protein